MNYHADLESLREKGLTYADCAEFFGSFDSRADMVAEARDLYADELIEIDDKAIVSMSPPHGAWVLGWLWIDLAMEEEE